MPNANEMERVSQEQEVGTAIDPLVSTKEYPGPFDAIETAKPGEPLFPLQGGDPLAPALIQLWANATRIRAGVAIAGLDFKPLTDAAYGSLVHDERKIDGLLLKATAAEHVKWAAQDYQRGVERQAAGEEEALHHDVEHKLDVHDTRRRAVSRITNAVAEIDEQMDALRLFELELPDNVIVFAFADMKAAVEHLNEAAALIEIKRG